jgi:hypothetical protein
MGSKPTRAEEIDVSDVQLVPGNSLITASPEDGRALALKMARLVVKATQPEDDQRERMRPDYSTDPNSLIAVAHVVATEFATIAAANDYWR